MTAIEEGQPAPDFELQDDSGQAVSLSKMRGRPVVLYFYPKDDTPGCTKEACAFRDALPRFEGADAVILGVSPDSVESHQKFKAKYDLPFQLLADVDHKVAEQYGVWGKKNLYGREFFGVTRATFLIAPDGTIARAWKRVKVEGHDEQVLEALGALKA